MYVNVDWFFLSHRLDIAENALKNNIDMTVFADLTKNHNFSEYKNFNFKQSSITRSRNSLPLMIYEFFITFFHILKNKPDLIHAVTIKPILYLGIIAKLLNIPFIGAISGLGPAFKANSPKEKIRLFFIISFYRLIFRQKKSYVICQSDYDRSVLIKKKIASKNKIIIIKGSGVNLNKFRPRKKLLKIEPFVLMASRILSDKGVIEFCKASKIVNNNFNEKIEFVLAGPIDIESPTSMTIETTQQLCEENSVTYLGNIKNIKDLLPQAILFIYPSYYPEGIPKVLLEASACGVPIVTTDHPGCRDAVINDETGVLVKPMDVESLASKIITLLKDNQKLRDMSLKSRELAKEQYSIEMVVAKHYNLYKNMI